MCERRPPNERAAAAFSGTVGLFVLHYAAELFTLWSGFTLALIVAHSDDERGRKVNRRLLSKRDNQPHKRKHRYSEQ